MIKVIQIFKKNINPNKWSGGETYEYFIYPENSEYTSRDFDFRISSASIDKIPSDFTQFEGYFRYLIMLDNSLIISRNSIKEEYSKHEIFKFKSHEKIISNSLGNDFNLMVSNNISEHELEIFVGSKVVNSNWIILFSLTETKISINQIEKKLIPNECVIIENFEKQDIKIDVSVRTIVAFINLRFS